jgi:hypothetical protein
MYEEERERSMKIVLNCFRNFWNTTAAILTFELHPLARQCPQNTAGRKRRDSQLRSPIEN